MDWVKTTARQDEEHLIFGFRASYTRGLKVSIISYAFGARGGCHDLYCCSSGHPNINHLLPDTAKYVPFDTKISSWQNIDDIICVAPMPRPALNPGWNRILPCFLMFRLHLSLGHQHWQIYIESRKRVGLWLQLRSIRTACATSIP